MSLSTRRESVLDWKSLLRILPPAFILAAEVAQIIGAYLEKKEQEALDE